MKFLDDEGFAYFWNKLKGHVIYNGTCTTAANNANKVVVLNPRLLNKGSDSIPENVQIRIRFANPNTASNPVLKVDGGDYFYPIEDPNGTLITPNQIASLSGLCTFVFQKTGLTASEGRWILFGAEKSLVDRIVYSESEPPAVENRFEGMIWLKKKTYVEPSANTPSENQE